MRGTADRDSESDRAGAGAVGPAVARPGGLGQSALAATAAALGAAARAITASRGASRSCRPAWPPSRRAPSERPSWPDSHREEPASSPCPAGTRAPHATTPTATAGATRPARARAPTGPTRPARARAPTRADPTGPSQPTDEGDPTRPSPRTDTNDRPPLQPAPHLALSTQLVRRLAALAGQLRAVRNARPGRRPRWGSAQPTPAPPRQPTRGPPAGRPGPDAGQRLAAVARRSPRPAARHRRPVGLTARPRAPAASRLLDGRRRGHRPAARVRGHPSPAAPSALWAPRSVWPWPAPSRSSCTRRAPRRWSSLGCWPGPGYALFPASFAIGFAFITTLTVFLLNAISPDTLSTASARLLDTAVGSALGLIAFALWPTWSRRPARRALADLAAAQRDYIAMVLSFAGRRPPRPEDELRQRSRQARLARTTAQETVALFAVRPRQPAHRRRLEPEPAGLDAPADPGRPRPAPRRAGQPQAPAHAGPGAPGHDARRVCSPRSSDRIAAGGIPPPGTDPPDLRGAYSRVRPPTAPRDARSGSPCSPNSTRSSTPPEVWPRWSGSTRPTRPSCTSSAAEAHWPSARGAPQPRPAATPSDAARLALGRLQRSRRIQRPVAPHELERPVGHLGRLRAVERLVAQGQRQQRLVQLLRGSRGRAACPPAAARARRPAGATR